MLPALGQAALPSAPVRNLAVKVPADQWPEFKARVKPSEGPKAPAIPPKSPPSECTNPVKSAKKWSGCPPAIYNGFRGRIDSDDTDHDLCGVCLSCELLSCARRGKQQHGSGSPECASRGDAASSHQAEANPITARGRKRWRGPGCAATAVANRPASSHGCEAATKQRRATGTPARRVSGLSRRINIAGGVLALPKVVYYGVPVILDVPGLGFVDVPEDEYARLYEKLSSSDSEQVEEAMSSLRRIKALEDAEVEAHERGPERTGPGDIQDLSGRISKDLSEPIFFHSRGQTRSRRLY